MRLQSALDPAGPQAASIGSLWWLFFWITAAIYAIVIALFIAALIRGKRNAAADASDEAERRAGRVVNVGVALTIVTLLGLLVASVATGHAVGTFAEDAKDQLEIDVIGHQWWWEIHYPNNADQSQSVVTANEMHVPVGRPLLIRVATRDVIHSFWVPNLNGKLDLIPGRINRFRLRADRPGVYRGQCAEFCGLQHANMALVVTAEPPAAFDRWLAAQRQPASEPSTPAAARGKEVFLSSPCANCHNITGVDAYATLGPDLTHVASRPTLGAGTLINNRGNLAGWIVNAPAVKPGVAMPRNELAPQELSDLLAYLETLR